jgi:acyl transferase domain-containing protein
VSLPPLQASLLDVCGTFAVNRSELRYRRAYVSSSVADLRSQLAVDEATKAPPSVVDGSLPGPVAMVFTGQVIISLALADFLLMCVVVGRQWW